MRQDYTLKHRMACILGIVQFSLHSTGRLYAGAKSGQSCMFPTTSPPCLLLPAHLIVDQCLPVNLAHLDNTLREIGQLYVDASIFVVFRRAEGGRSGDTRRAELIEGDYRPIEGPLFSFLRHRGDLLLRMLRIYKVTLTEGEKSLSLSLSPSSSCSLSSSDWGDFIKTREVGFEFTTRAFALPFSC